MPTQLQRQRGTCTKFSAVTTKITLTMNSSSRLVPTPVRQKISQPLLVVPIMITLPVPSNASVINAPTTSLSGPRLTMLIGVCLVLSLLLSQERKSLRPETVTHGWKVTLTSMVLSSVTTTWCGCASWQTRRLMRRSDQTLPSTIIRILPLNTKIKLAFAETLSPNGNLLDRFIKCGALSSMHPTRLKDLMPSSSIALI